MVPELTSPLKLIGEKNAPSFLYLLVETHKRKVFGDGQSDTP